MNEEKIKEIDEYIEKRVHSHSQSIEKVVYSLQGELRGIREDLPKIVKETVNGKIDNIAKHLVQQDVKLELMDKKIDDLQDKTSPVVESINVISSLRKLILYVAAPLAAVFGAIKFFK